MKKNIDKRVTVAAVLMLCIIALVSCSGKKTAETETEAVLIPVEAKRVSEGNITEYRKFSGMLSARESVMVFPSMTGELKNISAKVGDKVEKDQVLAMVDPSRDGQTYNMSKIKAPISGTITTLSGVEGLLTAPSAVFAVIENLDDLEISFSVIERYVTKVSKGNKVLVTFDAIEDEVFTATVTEVNPTIDAMTRTRSAKAKLDKNDSRLVSGMFARLNVITQVKENVLVVPFSAITVNGEETTAYIVKDGKACKVSVTTGIREADSVEITSGLSKGDMLVTKGKDLLADGTAVKVIN